MMGAFSKADIARAVRSIQRDLGDTPAPRRAAHRCDRAGCRYHAKNQESGTVTSVYDAAVQDIDADTRFVAVCEPHGSIIDAVSLKDALYLRAHPVTENWCVACASASRESR